MSIQITKQIIQLALTLFALISAAGAAHGSECSTAPDAVSDAQELADKIVSHLKAQTPEDIAKVSTKSVDEATVMNHKFHKLDRSKEALKKFDSVGILTGKPFNGKMQTYGSSVLISPCHVLTNKHVVQALAEDANDSLKTGNKVYFSVGQAKSCESSRDFEEQSLNAKVYALGTDDSASQDWAIVKLDRPVDSGIQPAYLSPESLGIYMKAVRVGFPYEQVKDEFGFKNSRAQYVRSESAGFRGIMYVSDKASHQGLSGGAIFSLGTTSQGKLKPTLTGIQVGGDQTLSLKSIFGTISEKMPEVAEDIRKSFKADSCQ